MPGTMRDVMDHAARAYRIEPALRSVRRTLNYGELIDTVRRNAMRLCGTSSDKYVLLLSKNKELREDTVISIQKIKNFRLKNHVSGIDRSTIL